MATVKLTKWHDDIRDVLRQSEDGLTISEISSKLLLDEENLRVSIRSIFGVYIDRWSGPHRGQYAAIYMCAEVPENAPKPEKKNERA